MLDIDLDELLGDPAVTSAKGIYEYLLGGKTDKQLLAIGLFNDATKRAAYEKQTQKAKAANVSNCALRAAGDNANKGARLPAVHATPPGPRRTARTDRLPDRAV